VTLELLKSIPATKEEAKRHDDDHGSVFHDCARNKEFQNDNHRIQYIEDMWYSVETKGGSSVFAERALTQQP
jgi:hypothetical protein